MMKPLQICKIQSSRDTTLQEAFYCDYHLFNDLVTIRDRYRRKEEIIEPRDLHRQENN